MNNQPADNNNLEAETNVDQSVLNQDTLEEFDYTSEQDVKRFMKKYTKKFPQLDQEILWQLFLHYQGDTQQIKKHAREILKGNPKKKSSFVNLLSSAMQEVQLKTGIHTNKHSFNKLDNQKDEENNWTRI